MSKILIVANSSEDRSILGLVLEFGGHCCELASNLQEATNLLQKASFDLVIADCRRGTAIHTLARRLRVASPKTNVVFLSGTPERNRQEVDELLLSPCSPHDLLDSIQNVLQRKPPGAVRHTRMATREVRA